MLLRDGMDAQKKRQIWHLILQPLAALVFLFSALIVFHEVAVSTLLWALGAGSLASSTYTVFGKPSAKAAKPFCMINAYLLAMSVSIILRYVANAFFETHHIVHMTTVPSLWTGFLGALAVGISLLLMALLGLEHPPAAGMSLVLVLDVHGYETLVVIIGLSCLLGVIRWLFDQWLTDILI